MMGYKNLKFEFNDGVALITLNRPDISNALNIPLGEELSKCLDTLKDDESIRAVVITGTEKSFSSGGDLKGMKTAIDEGKPKEFMMQLLQPIYEIVAKIRNLPKPVIAVVNGYAAGAGMNLALACDIIIASEKAVFSQAFINVGLIPGMGGTFFLPRYIGRNKAAELFFTGKRINANEAEKLGIVNEVVAPEKLAGVAWDLATNLANKPTRAIARTKALLNQTYLHSVEEHLELERKTQIETSCDEDFAEGVTAFWEKRKPIFQGK
ncbi:MAG: enoyl-CoA hydratase/isomerase family protein [Candidatus Hermodarchaeota archaeon]